MAKRHVAKHYESRSEIFLSTEQLHALATKISGAKLDIDEIPCVYLFVSLIKEVCIKVGETSNARNRFVDGHFNTAKNGERANLCNYYMEKWPQSINDDELVAIILPMHGVAEEDRKTIEAGLISILTPAMP